MLKRLCKFLKVSVFSNACGEVTCSFVNIANILIGMSYIHISESSSGYYEMITSQLTYTGPVSRRCEFKSRSSQHFSVDFVSTYIYGPQISYSYRVLKVA